MYPSATLVEQFHHGTFPQRASCINRVVVLSLLSLVLCLGPLLLTSGVPCRHGGIAQHPIALGSGGLFNMASLYHTDLDSTTFGMLGHLVSAPRSGVKPFLRGIAMHSSFAAARPGNHLMTRAVGDGAFEQKRNAVKQCLVREYKSFFRPFEEEFYSDGVTFKDPLNRLSGKASYKGNVEMLSGDSFLGNILFSDGFIDLHAVEDMPGQPTRFRTRWTLGFVFKLLPWRPKALFSGVSEYTIDPSSALILSQRDYWDILSLQDEGSYVPETALDGVADLVKQLLPTPLKPAEAKEPAAASGNKWMLLRRARSYRIYRNIDGLVFAVEAPGYRLGLEGVERELKVHGLSPGERLKMDRVDAILVQPPHPWDCDPP